MDIQVTQIIFQIINFAVILFVFQKFIYKSVIKMLDARSEKIKQGIEAAEKNIRLGQELETEKQHTLSQAKQQAIQILNDAQIQADQILKQAETKAKQETKKIIQHQQQAFTSLQEEQTKAFQKKASRTIITATESVLSGLLDKKLHTQIIDRQIKSLSPQLFK